MTEWSLREGEGRRGEGEVPEVFSDRRRFVLNEDEQFRVLHPRILLQHLNIRLRFSNTVELTGEVVLNLSNCFDFEALQVG